MSSLTARLSVPDTGGLGTVLDRMRAAGDDPADGAIRLWQANVPDVPVHRFAHLLVGFENAPAIDQLLNILSVADAPLATAIDPKLRSAECICTDDDLRIAQDVFCEYGLKMLMTLVFYSLPAAYAARNGVRVLHWRNGGTGFFVTDVNRRLIETTQFVIEVYTPGSLAIAPSGPIDGHGRAVRSALRVRLLHAAVRSLIEAHTDPRWNARELGRPVNQEDMAGTLMSFSCVVIDGLRKLHLRLSPQQEEAVYQLWKKVGTLLGVDPQLIPPTLQEAELLTKEIRTRQVDGPILQDPDGNVDGTEMTAKLLDFLRDALPGPLRYLPGSRRLPASVMRFFLPCEPADVAASLGVPRTYVLDELVRFGLWFEAKITRFRFFDAANRLVFDEWGRRDPRARALFQGSRFMMKRLLTRIQLFDRNAPLKEKHREGRMDLLAWDRRWHLDQADFVTRGMRRARRALSGRK